jgi:ribonuclease P protein component
MAVRTGRRVSTAHTVLYLRGREESEATRFGFIISKAVGNSVTRNLVRRRLRSVGHELLASQPHGTDIVVRALPGSDQVSWSTLQGEIVSGLNKGVRKP